MNQAEQDEQDQANLKLLQDAGYPFGSVADMRDWLAEWDRAKAGEARTIWPGHDWAPGCANLPPAGENGDW